MIVSNTLIIAAFLIGIGSSGHCLMMCGGISSAISTKINHYSRLIQIRQLLLFHAGRISTYTLVGLLVGTTLGTLLTLSPFTTLLTRIISSLLIIVIGLYIAGINAAVKKIEQRLAFIWKALQPYTQRYLKMQNWYHAYLLGGLWGFLPCGMIYSTALWAGSATHGVGSALLMTSFGLGTLPALFISNFINLSIFKQLERFKLKRIAGILLIIYGIFSIAILFYPMHHHSSSNHSDMHQHHHH